MDGPDAELLAAIEKYAAATRHRRDDEHRSVLGALWLARLAMGGRHARLDAAVRAEQRDSGQSFAVAHPYYLLPQSPALNEERWSAYVDQAKGYVETIGAERAARWLASALSEMIGPRFPVARTAEIVARWTVMLGEDWSEADYLHVVGRRRVALLGDAQRKAEDRGRTDRS